MDQVKIEAMINKFEALLIPTMSDEWASIKLYPPTKHHSEAQFRFYVRGITKGTVPLYFMAWTYIDPKDFIGHGMDKCLAYLEAKAQLLAMKLEGYLDKRCCCVPGEYGQVGEPCLFHQGIITRFPEGAEL